MSQYEDRQRLAGLFAKEVSVYVSTHPKSQTAHQKSQASLVNGVPMLWMAKWPGPFPIYVDSAKGAHFTDLDGNDFTDFCLGDTGATVPYTPRPLPTNRADNDTAVAGMFNRTISRRC